MAAGKLIRSSDFLCLYWMQFFKAAFLGYFSKSGDLFSKAVDIFNACWMQILFPTSDASPTLEISVEVHFSHPTKKHIDVKLVLEPSDHVIHGLAYVKLELEELTGKTCMFYSVLDKLMQEKNEKELTSEGPFAHESASKIRTELSSLVERTNTSKVPKLIQRYKQESIKKQKQLETIEHLNPNIKLMLGNAEIEALIYHGLLFLLLYLKPNQFNQYFSLIAKLQNSVILNKSPFIYRAATILAQLVTAEYYDHSECVRAWFHILVTDLQKMCPVLEFNKQRGGEPQCLTCDCVTRVLQNQGRISTIIEPCVGADSV